jgi:hypothetical protein
MTARRWALVIVLLLLVIGLLGYARGHEHHRGNQVGALGATSAAA